MSANRKKILIILIFFLSYFLFSYLFLFPNFLKIKELSQELSKLKTDYLVLEERRENIESFRKKFSQIKENLSLFENALVEKDFPINFIKFLENLAKNENVSLEIGSPYQKEGFLYFQLRIEGETSRFLRFLEKLENCQYLATVEKVHILKLSNPELKDLEEKSVVNLKGEVLIGVSVK